MIFGNNDKNIVSVYLNGAVSAIYEGTRLIWQSVRSCFGSGSWINDKPWLNDEGWKNE